MEIARPLLEVIRKEGGRIEENAEAYRKAIEEFRQKEMENQRKTLETLFKNLNGEIMFVGVKAEPLGKVGVQVSHKSGEINVFTGMNVGDSVVKLGMDASMARSFTGLNVASVVKAGVDFTPENGEVTAGLDIAGHKVGLAMSFDKGVSAGVNLGPVGKVGFSATDRGFSLNLGPLGNFKLW